MVFGLSLLAMVATGASPIALAARNKPVRGHTPKPSPSPTSTSAPSPKPTATPSPSPSSTATAVQFLAPFTPSRILTVCSSGCDFKLPSQAFANSQDYDEIEIKAGDYVDCGTLNANHLWVRGVGGMPHIHDKVCGYKGIFITNGSNITIDNIEFSGYDISSSYGNNAAGIRGQGANLTVRNSYFHDGQDGILYTPPEDGLGNVLIQNSRFERNGADGYEHDLYINHVATFTIENSTVEQAYLGHEVKTRAHKSILQCNRILGGYDSNYQDSYNIDMPNGGNEQILNNLIAQGPYEQNPIMVAFGSEGLSNPDQSLQVAGNIFINDLGRGTFINVFNAPAGGATVFNNKFIGGGDLIGGSAAASVSQSGNTTYADRTQAGISQQFPMPAACTAPVGNVPVK